MKSLKHCIKLSSYVKIYIPSTKNIDENIENKEWVAKASHMLGECFGGATASDGYGVWVSQKGSLISEKVVLVMSYCRQESLDGNIERIYSFCLDMKKELNQEAISLEINGSLYLI